MINDSSIIEYRGVTLDRGESFVYIPAHSYLSPYIANYTITCPKQGGMPADYTILPSGSATICYSINQTGISGGLRGVNTKACVVGASAIQADLLLLIEFRPAGLWPFVRIPQHELLDVSVGLSDLNTELSKQIIEALLVSETIDNLVARLNQILLIQLSSQLPQPQLTQAMASIMKNGGLIGAHKLAQEVCYSERQLRRIFLQQLGMGINTFSRIVRVNHAINIMQASGTDMTAIANTAGFFDQPHFIHEFKALCGISPTAYLKRMSVFYNDVYKL